MIACMGNNEYRNLLQPALAATLRFIVGVFNHYNCADAHRYGASPVVTIACTSNHLVPIRLQFDCRNFPEDRTVDYRNDLRAI